jgi:hypothetical protein
MRFRMVKGDAPGANGQCAKSDNVSIDLISRTGRAHQTTDGPVNSVWPRPRQHTRFVSAAHLATARRPNDHQPAPAMQVDVISNCFVPRLQSILSLLGGRKLAGPKLEPFFLALIRSRIEERQFARFFEERFRKEFDEHSSKRIENFYLKAAKRILKDFDIDAILERTSTDKRQFARITVRENEVGRLLERYKHYIPELVPGWASGRAYLNGLDRFIPAFSNTLHASLKTILNDLVSSDDLERIEQAVENTAKGAPLFEPVQGRLKFRPIPPKQPIKERKAVVRQKCDQAKRLCERQANAHPDIKLVIDTYDDALGKLRNAHGAYRLFLAGLDIECLLEVKSSLPKDDDRNPLIDADLLFALNSLITAHAGLIMLFPDAANFAHELDSYRQQSEKVDALRDRVLDPVLERLATAKGLFDKDTEHLTALVNDLGAKERSAGLSPSAGVVAVKHGWLRGSLAAIARVVIKRGGELAKAARDGIVGNAAYEMAKQPENLVAAITTFLLSARGALLHLAEALPAAFGWLRQMLGFFF